MSGAATAQFPSSAGNNGGGEDARFQVPGFTPVAKNLYQPDGCHSEFSCSGGAPPGDENGLPSAHGSTSSPRAVGIPFVLRLSKDERDISRAATPKGSGWHF